MILLTDFIHRFLGDHITTWYYIGGLYAGFIRSVAAGLMIFSGNTRVLYRVCGLWMVPF